MKKLLILFAAVAFLAACSDEDEKIVPKDYGMKKFAADMKYDSSQKGHGKAGFNCKQQTYMKLGQDTAVATAIYGNDNYTIFNILPEIPDANNKMIKNEAYNVTTNVKNWDLLFTQYVGNGFKAMGMDGILVYNLAGVLINTKNIKVAVYEYTKSENANDISEAFYNLKLSDISSLEYTNEIDAIGTTFRKMEGMGNYFVLPNRFFILKTTSNDIYKLHFISFYGKTTEEKVFTCEYTLMQ